MEEKHFSKNLKWIVVVVVIVWVLGWEFQNIIHL